MSRPARQSLARSFAATATAPDRAAGLQGLLPARPAAPEGPAASRDLSVVPDQSEPARLTESVAPAPVRTSPGSAADVVRSVAVYLPVDLLERLRTTTRSRQMTYAELLVEAAAAHLEGLSQSFQTPRPATRPSGMPARPNQGTRQPGVQVQLRLDGHQVAWLDDQAARLGASSRTALVVALLRPHLGSDGHG